MRRCSCRSHWGCTCACCPVTSARRWPWTRDALSAHTLPDGRLGLFHPDHLTFGGAVHLSAVLAAVQAVPGVQSVQVTTFERLRVPASSGLTTGVLPMGRLEIPRLDDDPSFPSAASST